METTNVNGSLDRLLKNIPNISAEELVGKPITDGNNNVIGAITYVDEHSWYGYINGGIDVLCKPINFQNKLINKPRI